MSTPIAELHPQSLWSYFVQLNAVPRPSKQEARVIGFIQEFGRGLGLPVSTDETGNVLIRKSASPGKEDRPVVALQSHLDMVHQKNAGTDFDFDREGIRMVLDGDWVKAQGTTLGADNGIGVAAMLALLASHEVPHPALEALFTVDEETGMTGAKGLPGGLLRAAAMLNLDTEDDRELTIGCAGGVDVLASCTYPTVAPPAGHEFLRITLDGLSGGHSGTDIHLGRANANKLMNRFLFGAATRFGARLSSIDGGGLRNAIPRESVAVIALPGPAREPFQAYLLEQAACFQAEYRQTDAGLRLQSRPEEAPQTLVEGNFQVKLLGTIYGLVHGIYRMSPDVPGLVQTSNNLARVLVREGDFSLQCLTRGSLGSEKMDLATTLCCPLILLGAQVSLVGEYPGWVPRPDSGLVKLMSDLYQELFQDSPQVTACHAGLECGILGQNYPEMEMISFGPNIRGAHSPDERVQISSVQKFWHLLTQTLERL